MEASSEICKESVNTNLVYPEGVFFIRVLTEVEVQILVLVPVCIWMHLIKNATVGLDRELTILVFCRFCLIAQELEPFTKKGEKRRKNCLPAGYEHVLWLRDPLVFAYNYLKQEQWYPSMAQFPQRNP